MRLSPLLIVAALALPVIASAQYACTMDARACPDGSYVGREGPNCEFAACPGEVRGCTKELKICPDGTGVGRTGLNCAFAPCPGESFSDVPADHPNGEAIAYVKAEGIVEGYADGTFKPDQTINRAEFTKIIIEAVAGDEEIRQCDLGGIAYMSDMKAGFWYAPYVCVSVERGIVTGHIPPSAAPYFGGSEPIVAITAAKIITASLGIGGPPMDCLADWGRACTEAAEQGDIWFRRHIEAMAELNAIPLSVTSFQDGISRGEMAEMIWRLKAGVTDKPSRTFEELAVNDTKNVVLYFNKTAQPCGDEQIAFGRDIPLTANSVQESVRLLLAGPLAHESRGGASTNFDNTTGYFGNTKALSEYYRGVTVRDGVAIVDFEEGAMAYLNNSACMQTAVKRPIEKTLMHFQSVTSVEFSIDGEIVTEWDA